MGSFAENFGVDLAGVCMRDQIIGPAGIEGVVGVRHPGHFALTRSHVRAWYVFTRTYVFFSDQLSRKSARDLLKLLFVVLFRIETNATLGSAKRHVDDGAFVGHQCCQRLDFILTDELAVSNATPNRFLVLTDSCAPAFEDFEMI